MRVVTLQHAGLGDFTAVVQLEADFGGLELDRTPLLARLGQGGGFAQLGFHLLQFGAQAGGLVAAGGGAHRRLLLAHLVDR